MLVANGQTERDSELLASRFKLDLCIRHQSQCEDEPQVLIIKNIIEIKNFVSIIISRRGKTYMNEA
jgi:hypothetical protein